MTKNVVPLPSNGTPRLVDLQTIRTKILPLHVSRTPCEATVRSWLKAWGIVPCKVNMNAKRGGGLALYAAAKVEARLRQMSR